MKLKNFFSAPAQGERRQNQRDDESMGESGGRLRRQLRSGRLAIWTGAVWIVRGLRSREKRGRRLALGTLALGVGLLQRRARREGQETLSSAEYTDTITGSKDEGIEAETEMTEVELGGSDERTDEPPEDIQTDMEASGEMTDDEEDFGLDEGAHDDSPGDDTEVVFDDETEETDTEETGVDADEGEETTFGADDKEETEE